MKKLILSLIISVGAANLYAATVANVQKLSSFGTTNSISTNDLITVSTQPGTVNEHLGGITFSDMLNRLHNIEGWINIKLFGAKGDGITDDTAAFARAIAYGGNIIIPYTTNGYLVGTLNFSNNCFMAGWGGKSRLILNNNSNGFLINATNTLKTSFYNLEFDGGSNRSFYPDAFAGSAGTRHGLMLNSLGNTRVFDISVHGFSGYGISITSTNGSIDPLIVASNANSILSMVDISYCYGGIRYGDTSSAEYQMASDINIRNCAQAFILLSGNLNISHCIVTLNGTAVYLTGGGNTAHGNFNNSLVNHNFYTMYIDGITSGFNFIGNQMFTGAIFINNSSGVRIGPGELDASNITITGTGAGNRIEGNYCNEGSANAITNVGGALTCTIFNNPKRTSGSWLGTPGFYGDGLGSNVLFNGGITVTNGINYSGVVSNTASIGQTANRWAGRGRLTAGQQIYIVTNNIVTANTIVIATLSTNDATATSISATPTAGLLTIKANAAATGNADISWLIVTP